MENFMSKSVSWHNWNKMQPWTKLLVMQNVSSVQGGLWQWLAARVIHFTGMLHFSDPSVGTDEIKGNMAPTTWENASFLSINVWNVLVIWINCVGISNLPLLTEGMDYTNIPGVKYSLVIFIEHCSHWFWFLFVWIQTFQIVART